MKYIIRSLIPPIIFNFILKIKNYNYGWKGNFDSWQSAQQVSLGYNSENILSKVSSALLKVKNGEAVYERDSVLFNEIHYSWPLLNGLLFSALKSGGRLNVLDFGGSLGSTYYQNKIFFNQLSNISWNIVEQSHFVDIGRRDFEDARLKFYHTIDECMQAEQPNILLLSSVLQYIEKPFDLLDNLLEYNFDFILIDRTPFSIEGEVIKNQIVPTHIYKASYPCRFFNEVLFLKYFKSKNFYLLEKFDAIDGTFKDYYFKGYILINEKLYNVK
jgi:putative methyltransferase (TIGR04325 family)